CALPISDRALTDLLLEALDQLDQGERVGIEVIDEAVALLDGVGLDLEDVSEAISDEGQDLVAIHLVALHVGLCGQRVPLLGRKLLWRAATIAGHAGRAPDDDRTCRSERM